MYSLMRGQMSLRHASASPFLLFTIAVLTACQAAGNTTPPQGNNDRFMNLWSTYTICMASSDFEVVQRASDQLRIVRKQSEWYAGKHFLPGEDIPQFSTQAPSRLAVDLHAMAAACAIHAGDIASEGGRENIARQLYSEVLASYEETAYSFYVLQARSRLAQP
jgi:hypothetical protein